MSRAEEVQPGPSASQGRSPARPTPVRGGGKMLIPQAWRNFYVGRLLERKQGDEVQVGEVRLMHNKTYGKNLALREEHADKQWEREYEVVWKVPGGGEVTQVLHEGVVQKLALQRFADEPWVLDRIRRLQAAGWDANKVPPTPPPAKRAAAKKRPAKGAAGGAPAAKRAKQAKAPPAKGPGKAVATKPATTAAGASKASASRGSSSKAANTAAQASTSRASASAGKASASKASSAKAGKASNLGAGKASAASRATAKGKRPVGGNVEEMVFSADGERAYPARLCLTAGDRLLEEYRDEAADEEYTPEYIMDEREMEDGTREYLVKWRGFELDPEAWEPEETVDECAVLSVWIKNRRRLRL
ncbi:hypothetical protein WJX72_007462 [[Myrmecia] bisecta]|uniref:Chromo domain-containing protein n=1 Tax=[Myrmecia] bisecta TaxID=41462 RepID=A0AAW1QS41_9CHLO